MYMMVLNRNLLDFVESTHVASSNLPGSVTFDIGNPDLLIQVVIARSGALILKTL